MLLQNRSNSYLPSLVLPGVGFPGSSAKHAVFFLSIFISTLNIEMFGEDGNSPRILGAKLYTFKAQHDMPMSGKSVCLNRFKFMGI